MTSKIKLFQLWVLAYQKKAKNPGNRLEATNSVFDIQMTSNDLWQPLMSFKIKSYYYGFMHIKQKLRPQRLQLQQQIQCLNL